MPPDPRASANTPTATKPEAKSEKEAEKQVEKEEKEAEKAFKKLEQNARKIANENTGPVSIPAGEKIFREPLGDESPVPASAMQAAVEQEREESKEEAEKNA